MTKGLLTGFEIRIEKWRKNKLQSFPDRFSYTVERRVERFMSLVNEFESTKRY